jgi:hypothetical protein
VAPNTISVRKRDRGGKKKEPLRIMASGRLRLEHNKFEFQTKNCVQRTKIDCKLDANFFLMLPFKLSAKPLSDILRD